MKFILPTEPVELTTPPSGPGWVHEVKWDGFRLQLHKDGKKAWALSINGKDLTSKFRWVAAAVGELPCKSCIIDAEGVAPTPEGGTDFRALIGGQKHKMGACFDLLELNGRDMRPFALSVRRARLARLMKKADPAVLQFSVAYRNAEKLLADLSAIGGEGIVSKKADQPYVSGKNRGWIKVKCHAWREANSDRGEMFRKHRN